MKLFNLFSILVFSTLIAMTSCKEKAADDANTAPDAAEASAVPVTTDPAAMPAQDPNAAIAADPNAPAATPVPTGPLTSIKFEQMSYDWGTVMDGEKVTKIFKFKNTGKEPLIITKANATCGCTVPDWPKDAIAPGKSGEIKVVYDSKGKGAVGGKDDSKRVTITANTDPMDTYLEIKGKVNKKADEAGK
ncbi:MAG: DUF1573 domain-containing protein [Saprospiraceae bacterium]